jgi:hypothetical protein
MSCADAPASKLALEKAAASCRTPKLRVQDEFEVDLRDV